MTTTAKEWREKRNAGVPITLPEFGDEVRIKPMDAEFFFRSGSLPDFLAGVIHDMIGSKGYTLPVPSEEQKTREWLDWLDNLMISTFVSPKVISGTPQNDDEISVDEIGYPDKLFIYAFFGRPAQVLRNFRPAPAKPVALVDAAKNNGAYAQQAPGDTALVERDARSA